MFFFTFHKHQERENVFVLLITYEPIYELLLLIPESKMFKKLVPPLLRLLQSLTKLHATSFSGKFTLKVLFTSNNCKEFFFVT